MTKKLFTVSLFIFVFLAAAIAQPKAVGLRVGGDAEVSYQNSIGENFLELDLGMAFVGRGLQLTGIYDFVFARSGNFNFYVGPGAQVNSWKDSEGEGKIGIALGGQIGAEYQIGAIPFNIALDYRPMWNFIGNYGSWSSAALSFRYRF